jgi:4-hydroxybenzoyl-CoA reductase subunit beta
MLPLPIFQHHAPETLDEAVALMAALGPDVKLIAGGTDLVPNMKHGLFEPEHLVSLGRVRELRGIAHQGDDIVIGAMTPLADIAADETVQRHAPALAEACGAVGGPHHRRMGTIGGNICLDTRCVYYNQTYFWREALGFCLKKDGSVCHVVTSGKKCVAAASNDSAPALMVHDADIELCGPGGKRTVNANDFYTADGIDNTVKHPDEIVTHVRLARASARRSGFEKLRRRGAIDFPLLNLALRIDLDGDQICDADLVVSTLAARPKRVKAVKKLIGAQSWADPDDALWLSLADAAFKASKPLTNLDNDPAWRREMVRVLLKKAARRVTINDTDG